MYGSEEQQAACKAKLGCSEQLLVEQVGTVLLCCCAAMLLQHGALLWQKCSNSCMHN
jgi:hypothetical protein